MVIESHEIAIFTTQSPGTRRSLPRAKSSMQAQLNITLQSKDQAHLSPKQRDPRWLYAAVVW